MPVKVMEQILLETVPRYVEGWEVIPHSQHSFTEGKCCLTNPGAFYRGVTTSLHKGGATGGVCLDFGKAFGTVPHNILLSKSDR